MTRRTAIALLFLVGCGGAPATSEGPTHPTTSAEVHTPTAGSEIGSLDDVAGKYSLKTSSAAANDCGGQLVLAAKHIQIEPKLHNVHADVVDRDYEARIEKGAMVAEGRFNVNGTCPGTQIIEQWTLERDAQGRLVGELVSKWSLPSDCARPCIARFPIMASRVSE